MSVENKSSEILAPPASLTQRLLRYGNIPLQRETVVVYYPCVDKNRIILKYCPDNTVVIDPGVVRGAVERWSNTYPCDIDSMIRQTTVGGMVEVDGVMINSEQARAELPQYIAFGRQIRGETVDRPVYAFLYNHHSTGFKHIADQVWEPLTRLPTSSLIRLSQNPSRKR